VQERGRWQKLRRRYELYPERSKLNLILKRINQKGEASHSTYEQLSDASEGGWNSDTGLSSSDDSESEFDDDSEDQDQESDFEISDAEEENGAESMNQLVSDLRYEKGAGKHLRASWGSGSERTERRRREEAVQLKVEASKCYDIRALWDRARLVGICKDQEESGRPEGSNFFENEDRIPLLEDIPRGSSPPKRRPTRSERQNAVSDLIYLLGHKKKIKERYGDCGGLGGTYQLRHDMVLQFLHAQLRKENHGLQRRTVALQVANSHGRGMHTARMLVQWETAWVYEREIPRGR